MQDDEQKKKQQAANFFHDLAAPGWDLDQRFFPAMGQRLVKLAELPEGGSALDVAAGRGASLFPAAEQVGETGRVVGIDLAPAMVQMTGAEIERRGLANTQMLQMDAENLDFPDAYFDRVLCGFALFFFPRLSRALAEFRRVLKPAGLVCVSTFAEGGYAWNWYEALLKAHSVSFRTDDWDDFVTEDLHLPSDLERVFGQADFVDLRITTETFDDVFADKDAWWEQVWASADRAVLERLSPSQLAAFKSDAFDRLGQLKQDDGIHATYRVLFTRATCPR
jgi:ubiquinone/menaquinone biosynthesis C-methylase UbiE